MVDEPRTDDGAPITKEEILRAVSALEPFVRRWRLSLNPEHLEEMAYAVLAHRDGRAVPQAPDGWRELADAVEGQIDEFEERWEIPNSRT